MAGYQEAFIPLSINLSFGFGDRPGLVTPGHIGAVRGTKFFLE